MVLMSPVGDSITSGFEPLPPDTPSHTTDRLTHCQSPFVPKHVGGRKQNNPPQKTVSILLPAPNSLVLAIPSPCLDEYCSSHLGSNIGSLCSPSSQREIAALPPRCSPSLPAEAIAFCGKAGMGTLPQGYQPWGNHEARQVPWQHVWKARP